MTTDKLPKAPKVCPLPGKGDGRREGEGREKGRGRSGHEEVSLRQLKVLLHNLVISTGATAMPTSPLARPPPQSLLDEFLPFTIAERKCDLRKHHRTYYK